MNVITAHTTQDLLAFVPFALGYTPTESVALMSLRGPRGRVGLTVRINIATIEQAAPDLVRHILDDGAHGTALVIYTADQAAATTAHRAVTDAARAANLAVVGAWHVDGDQFAPLTGNGTPDGPRQPINADTTVTAAAMVAAGYAVRASRADLDITPASPAKRGRARRAYLAVQNPGADPQAALLVWRAIRQARTVTTTSAGTLAAYLLDRTVRDAILSDLLDTSPDDADQVADGADTDLMSRIFDPANPIEPGPHTPDDIDTLRAVCALLDDAPARTLLAVLAWWTGNGAEASIHLDAARRYDPTYRLAFLMDQVVGLGMAPGWARADRV